jgi:hypothetical protein
MTESHPKLARIRALLAKAEATNFEAEAETYRAKANQLISEYGIDAALAHAEQAIREEVGEIEILISGAYRKDQRTLLASTFNALNCKTFTFAGKTTDRVRCFGYAADLERAEILYTSLLIQGLRGMKSAPQGYSGRGTMANRRAWFYGFLSRVTERIEESEQRAQDQAADTSTGLSVALVIRDRSALVKDHYESVLDGLRASGVKTSTRRTTLSGSGYKDGRAAGDRADIGHGRVGGKHAALR